MNPSSQIVVVSVGIRGAIGATTYAASAGLAKRPAPIKRAARREPPVVIEGNTQLTGCEGDTVLCFCTINRAFRAGRGKVGIDEDIDLGCRQADGCRQHQF